jgi:hypothetical protein
MIPTRQDIQDSLMILKAYEKLKTEAQVKILVASDIAKGMFPEFSSLKPEDQADILDMLIEEMRSEHFILH